MSGAYLRVEFPPAPAMMDPALAQMAAAQAAQSYAGGAPMMPPVRALGFAGWHPARHEWLPTFFA